MADAPVHWQMESASLPPDGAAAPAARRAAKVVLAAPFFAKPQRDTRVRGMLQAGEVLEVLSSLVDDNGRTKVQHARGWTPAFAPDGRQVLMDLGGGAVHSGENTRLPAAGARFRCVAAGVVPRCGLDMLALPRDGAAPLTVGEVLVVIELRALTGSNRCLRCREGWIDLLAPDGSPQLERIEGGAARDSGSMWEGELERVAQWLTVAGHGGSSAEIGPVLCDALRSEGVAPDAWMQTLAALAPEDLASRVAAAVAARDSALPASAAVSHAADLLGGGDYVSTTPA